MSPQDLTNVKMLGAAANGVLAALLNRDTLIADFPRRKELQGLKNDELYPVSLYIDLTNYVEERVGTYAFLRLGRKLGKVVMETSFPSTLKTVEEAIDFIQVAHEQFCRPVVGAFEVTERKPGALVMRYTAPYNCTLQEGLFYEIALRYGADNATVTHSACRRHGGDACRFEIKY